MVFAEPNNITGIYGMFEYANLVTENYFTMMIPIALFAIVFLYLKLEQHYTPDCLIAAGFLTSIVSVFLRIVGFMNSAQLIIVVIITALSAMWAVLTKKE